MYEPGSGSKHPNTPVALLSESKQRESPSANNVDVIIIYLQASARQVALSYSR
jgi:hypothetical protein